MFFVLFWLFPFGGKSDASSSERVKKNHHHAINVNTFTIFVSTPKNENLK